MKEQDLIKLGFKRTDVTAEESGYETDWYYYTYDFGKGALSLITQASTEMQDGKWHVEIFEDETIRFNNSEDIKALVDLINKNIINSKTCKLKDKFYTIA